MQINSMFNNKEQLKTLNRIILKKENEKEFSFQYDLVRIIINGIISKLLELKSLF